MKKELFDDLLESVREGGAILRGEREPSRRFAFEEPEVQSLSLPEFSPEWGGSVKPGA
jgi:putative transcriptional regulator